MQAKIIGIVNTKGGVTKTTTAVNLAAMLADGSLGAPERVLLVDMDPQGSAAKCVAQVNVFADANRSLTPALLAQPVGRVPLETVICQSPWSDSLFYVPVHSESMKHAAGEILFNHKAPYTILRRLLSPLIGSFDTIIVDFMPTAPNVNVFFFNALSAIQYAIIPTQLTELALEGLPETFHELETARTDFEQEIKVLGILPAEFRRTNSQDTFLTVLRAQYGGQVFDPIPLSTDVSDAFAARLPVHRYNSSAAATRAFKEFCRQVTARVRRAG